MESDCFQCDVIQKVLANTTTFPGSASYEFQQSRYWSNQQLETLPRCRVQPNSARDVAATLLVTSFFTCPFAVKSGGHAAFKGGSNIENGITLDLNNLKTVEVSSDKKTTLVGAGNRWIDVYSQLIPQNLSVVGGRVADIGVGGLTLGGNVIVRIIKPALTVQAVSLFSLVDMDGH
jgi:FAD binding domain